MESKGEGKRQRKGESDYEDRLKEQVVPAIITYFSARML